MQRRLLAPLLAVLLTAFLVINSAAAATGPDTSGPATSDVRPPSSSVTEAQPTPIEPALPTSLERTRAADLWRDVKDGTTGRVTIPDQKAARLIQTGGTDWMFWRNDRITLLGTVSIGAMMGLLVLFFLIKGRIRIDSGPASEKILRFTGVERFGHWMTAISFLVLAITGLNTLYGRDVLLPFMGADAFATLSRGGKWVHNFGGFVFIAGLLWIFVTWVRHNFWDRYDFNWILKGGGLVLKGVHPPATKFNFGQKTVFWMVILVGLGLSFTGLHMLMPFWFTTLEQMQLLQLLHAGLGVTLFALMLAHIYIGSLGMESAFDAMSTGWVDLNWAKEHHSVWVDEEIAKGSSKIQPNDRAFGQPAE